MTKDERQLRVQEKLVNTAEEVKDFVQEMKKTTKVGRYYLYLVICIMLLFYVGVLGYSIYASGGLNKWAEYRFGGGQESRKFNCWNKDFNITLNTIGEVNAWKQAFGVNCTMRVI